MTDEAHVSAEQPGAQAAPRVPRADGDGQRTQGDRGAPVARPQDAVGLKKLTRRADFLAANAGKRAPMPGFVLLVRPRGDEDMAMRYGITVTKKIGGAVVRNRMKRRFRALVRELFPQAGVRGADHVLIGRAGGVERDFRLLRAELAKALERLSQTRGRA
jgi:ribonuclease P protein component